MTLSINRSRTRAWLIERSLEVILAGQTPEGAYLACPEFPTYRYSWFRDGAFIARAMDQWDRTASSRAFHDWALRTLNGQAAAVKKVVEKLRAGEEFDGSSLLHTRYLPDGTAGSEDWPNFQLDGLGTWLWAFEQHLSHTGEQVTAEAKQALELVADYLVALWSHPNYDCWEEFPERVHAATLGAIYAGLRAAGALLGRAEYTGAAMAVRSNLLAHGVRGGSFVKHLGSDDVDGSLLWLTADYRVVPVSHAVSRATAERVRQLLLDPEGGVRRYLRDTYYGGGSWIILTAALAEDCLGVGEVDEARRLLAWIEAQATSEGLLPEQTARHLNDPSRLEEWERRWGKSACPLLWSHAAYLTLVKHLESL
jgi:GH15 family glucan-1,4-alpha-glucosidase